MPKKKQDEKSDVIAKLQQEYLGEVMRRQSDEEREQEIKRGYREIQYGGKIYRIKYPSLKIENDAIVFRAKKLKEMSSDYPPLRRLREELAANNIWTEKDDNKIEDLKNEIRAKKIDLAGEQQKYKKVLERIQIDVERLYNEKARIEKQKIKSKKDEKRLKEIDDLLEKKTSEVRKYGAVALKLSYEISDLCTDYAALMVEKLSYESGSLENQINNQTLYYKIINCVFIVDGETKTKEKFVWNSLEKFMNDKNANFIQKILNESQDFWRGDTSFFDELPGVISGDSTGI